MGGQVDLFGQKVEPVIGKPARKAHLQPDLFGDIQSSKEGPKARKHRLKVHGPMLFAHGRVEGHTCGECRFIFVRVADMAVRPLKCKRFGNTYGAGTDWRRWWPACGLFEPRDGG